MPVSIALTTKLLSRPNLVKVFISGHSLFDFDNQFRKAKKIKFWKTNANVCKDIFKRLHV